MSDVEVIESIGTDKTIIKKYIYDEKKELLKECINAGMSENDSLMFIEVQNNNYSIFEFIYIRNEKGTFYKYFKNGEKISCNDLTPLEKSYTHKPFNDFMKCVGDLKTN